MSGAAVSFSPSEQFLSSPLKAQTVRFESSIASQFDSTEERYNENIVGSASFTVSPERGFNYRLSFKFFADNLRDNYSADHGILTSSFWYSGTKSRVLNPLLGFSNTFPIGSLSSGTVPHEDLFTNHPHSYNSSSFSFIPLIGMKTGKSNRVIQSYLFIQPELVASPVEPALIHGSLLLKFAPFSKVTPEILAATTVPSNELWNQNILNTASLRITPAIQFQFPKHFDLRTDFTFGLGTATTSYKNHSFPIDPDFAFGITLGFRSDNFETIRKRHNKEITPKDTSTVNDPLFSNLSDYEKSGVRSRDKDRDGLPDSLDSCPEKKELFNGIEDLDGCPESHKTNNLTAIDETGILKGVVFTAGSSLLSPAAKNSLATLVNKLLKDDHAYVTLSSYTDNSGEYDVNMNICRERVESVRDYLIRQGVESGRITIELYGPNDPVADNLTQQGREKNRRIGYSIRYIR